MGRSRVIQVESQNEDRKLWVQKSSHLDAKSWSLLEIDLLRDLPPMASHTWQKEVFLLGTSRAGCSIVQRMELVAIRDQASRQDQGL